MLDSMGMPPKGWMRPEYPDEWWEDFETLPTSNMLCTRDTFLFTRSPFRSLAALSFTGAGHLLEAYINGKQLTLGERGASTPIPMQALRTGTNVLALLIQRDKPHTDKIEYEVTWQNSRWYQVVLRFLGL